MLIATLRQYLPSAFLLALVLVYSAAHASSEDIADVATSDAPVDTIKNKAEDLALTTANQKINIFEGIALDNGWTHLDLNLGWESGKPTLGIMSVYGLRETNNWFIFNQSSLVNYDERNTVNLGFGARHINDTDTLILGANAFYDYELNSGHQRTSLGIEWLTQPIQARANLYRNLTGSILYKGTYEEVLDGHDFKLAYRLPTTQISHLYYKTTNWSDSQAYRSSTGELGITSQITENVKMSLSAQKIDKESVSGLVSFTYSIPLGEPEADSGNNKSVRHMLYKPVQRENRIKKKSVKLGVTASGY